MFKINVTQVEVTSNRGAYLCHMFGANSVETFQTEMGAAIIHASLMHTDFSIFNDVIIRTVD